MEVHLLKEMYPFFEGPRENVDHTIIIGKRSNGIIDYVFDGEQRSSVFHKEMGVPSAWYFEDAYLRLRGASGGETVVFKDLTLGTTHSAPVPANYVLYGPMTIQSSINEANAGDTINVAAGTYNENVVIPAGKGNLKIIGAGSNVTTISITTGAAILTRTPITVEGFHIQGPGRGTGTAIKVEGQPGSDQGSGTVDNPGVFKNNKVSKVNYGLQHGDWNVHYWEFLNNDFSELRIGIGLENMKDVKVIGNTLKDYKEGVSMGWDADTASNVEIKDNKFLGDFVEGTDNLAAIVISSAATDIQVSGNDIKDSIVGVLIKQKDATIPDLTGVNINNNNIVGNTEGVKNEQAIVTVNAKNNWWGDLNPSNDVSGNVDYCPWLATEGGSPIIPPVMNGEIGYCTIQSAIDDADPGDTIEVDAGTYTENVVIDKSLNLIGEDKTTTIIDGNDDGNAITITAPDITLTGFTVTGGYANGGNIWDPYGGIVINGNDGTSALTNIVIDNNIIDGNDGNGIYVSAAGDGGSADNIKITNCVISNNGGSTSYFGSVTLTYGKFSGTDDTCNGPELEPYDEWRRPKNVLIEGNDLSNDISTGYVYGIYVNAGKDNTIRFNEIHGFSSKGLLMASSMPCAVIPTEYTTVENNKIYNNARNGIKLVSWNQYNTITGNNIYNNGFGYPGSDAFWMYGIQFKDGNDNTIEDNTITGNALGGLYLWGFGDSSYTWYSTTNNVITGNTISDHTETGGHGIYIPSLVRPDALGKAWPEGYDNSGFLNSNINNNTITNNLEYGIENADTSQTIDATDNWWGTISANEIATMISDNVDFAPWLDAAYPEGKSFAPVHNIDTDEWFLTIQEAIDDSDTDAGDKINVAAGTYNESINITKPLTLNGAKAGEDARTRNTGSGESILDGAGFTTAQYSLIMIANGVSNVVIDGFEFKNILLTSTGGGVGNAISSYCKSSSTAGADNITIKNNYMHDLGYNGILVVSENTTGTSMIVQTGWVIQYNKIAGYRYAGVELTNVANSKVKNNDIAAPTSLFVDPGDAGVGIEIAARSRSKPVTAGTNVEVSGNKITGTFPTGSRAAINLLSRAYSTTSDATLSGVTVSGNIISGAVNTRAAILAVSESRLNGPATINALAIANNILNGNLNAIEIQDYVNGGSGTATHSSVTITGNEIKNSTGIGLYLPTFTSATGITVSSNKFLTNALGIKNEGTGALKAEKNYWGVSTPDFDTVVVGDVDYDPWYTNAAKTALSDATYTDATYTSDTSGQADLPEDVTEVTLDDDTVLDVSGGMNTAIGNDIVVGGATLSLNSFTSGNITNTDLSTPQTIGGQSVKVEKAVKLTSGTAGQPITISNAGLANIKVDIPDATTILAPSGWDGKITPPKTGSKTGTAPSGFSVGDTVVEVGSEAGVLLFDKPVKVTLTGVTGEVAYRPTGSNTWQKITTVCDSATDPTNISFPGECYKIVGSDTIIFTYHFTAFASLAPTPAAPVSGGGIPLWLLQQQQQQAKPVAPKVEVAPIAPAPVTPATPVPTPQVLGEKIYGDGTLLRGSDKKIFVITDGQKKHIPNLKELAKYAGQKICDVENTVLIQYPEVLGIKVFADGMLIRGADAKVYVIKQGKKQYVKNLEELRANYFGKKIYDVSDETLAKY